MPTSAFPKQSDSDQTTAHYALRIGIHGQVGRFAASGNRYRRGMSVVCRTVRGLEVGQVLSPLQWTSVDSIANGVGAASSPEVFDGRIVRSMAAEDQLLWNHLKHLADEAHAACQTWLDDSGLPDRLLDVEPLLDGRTLYFHFLDKVSTETEQQIASLVTIFQQTVARSTFASLLETGCGPGCGTEKAKGCGSACASCQSRCR